jgi:hypothetical protein
LKAAASVSWPNRAFASVVKLSVKVPDALHWTVTVELWAVVAGGLLAEGLVEGGDAEAGRAYAPDISARVLITATRRFLIVLVLVRRCAALLSGQRPAGAPVGRALGGQERMFVLGTGNVHG